MAKTTANDIEVATKPPGPDELPLVGSLKDFFDDPLQFYTETADEYGPVAYFTLGGNDFVTVSSPEYVKDVLVNNDDEYVKGQQFDDLMGPICGNGVLLAEGDFWQSQRETLEPAFDPETLSRHCRVMTDYTQRRMERWTPGEERSIYEDLMYTTLEIAGKVLFDFDVRPLDGDIPAAMETVRDYVARRLWRPVEVPEWMPMPGKREYQEALALIDETAYTIIDEAKASDSDQQTVIDLLLDKDDPLSREQIRDEVFTLLLAAHENTTLSATYTLQLLAKNPYAMEKVHAELDEVLDGDAPTFTDLPRLTYLDKALTESLRLYPPVYSMLRETKADTTLAGYAIPEGTTVSCQQWAIHRDSTFYDDPLSYRPERWTDEFEESLPGFAYFPFGGGPRRCIASRFAKFEVKAILATMLRNWDLETTLEKIEFKPSISLRPDTDITMVPTPR